MKVPTPEEFKQEMQWLATRKHKIYRPDGSYEYGTDPAKRHRDMDRAFKRLLRSLGYGKAVDIFDRTGKWWS